MGAQSNDLLYAERLGIPGTTTSQEIADLRILQEVSEHTDVNITPSLNGKEVLKNNGLDIYENNTLRLDDLDDVNTTQLSPQIGWIMKHNGLEYVPCMREVYSHKDLVINNQTNFGNGVIMQPLVNFQRQGTYSFTFFCNYSCDATGSDIIMEAQLNGPLSLIADSEILRLEAKDAVGNNFDGRGTSQKHAFSQKFYKDLNFTGNLQLLWRVQPEANNVEASVWEATLIIEEEFGINYI